jgi:DNA-binding transcriptional LysR family regulator
MNIEDIKFREVELFLRLLKTKSVRELARQTNMQPGQLSKWIQGLEKKIGMPLIDRSSVGVQPTARALELIPYFEELFRIQGDLSHLGKSSKKSDVISIASSSFFTTHLVPLVLEKVVQESPDTTMRILDIPPTQFIPVALRGAFDYCLHAQKLDWPKTWTSYQVGFLSWNVFARKNHPLAKKSTKSSLLKYPFIVPIYWTPEGSRYGEDQCPVPISERIKGHETSTAASAVEMVKVTDQLSFLPDVVARPGVADGSLIAVETPWKLVKKPVYLSVKNAVVKQKQYEQMIAHFKTVLNEIM